MFLLCSIRHNHSGYILNLEDTVNCWWPQGWLEFPGCGMTNGIVSGAVSASLALVAIAGMRVMHE